MNGKRWRADGVMIGRQCASSAREFKRRARRISKIAAHVDEGIKSSLALFARKETEIWEGEAMRHEGIARHHFSI